MMDAPRERWRDRTFEDEDFVEADLDELATEACTFLNCDFSDAVLTGSRHDDSTFAACRFRGARLIGELASGVRFD